MAAKIMCDICEEKESHISYGITVFFRICNVTTMQYRTEILPYCSLYKDFTLNGFDAGTGRHKLLLLSYVMYYL